MAEKITCRPPEWIREEADAEPFERITRPTALQRKAFKLLGVRLERAQ